VKVSDLCGLDKTLADIGVDRRCVECPSPADVGHNWCGECYAIRASRLKRERVPSGPNGRTDIDKAWGY
jgi:hypothetical protein